MSQPKKPRLLPRLLAGAGYMACLLQWLWVMIMLLPALLDSGLLTAFSPPPQEQPVHQISSEPPSPVLVLVGGIVTILMLALTAVILIKFPSKVAQTGSAITHRATEVIVPAMTHHKRVSAKKRRLLTTRIMLYVKLVLVIVPFVGCFVVPVDIAFNRELVVFIGAFLATTALSLFGLEHATLFVQSRRTTS